MRENVPRGRRRTGANPVAPGPRVGADHRAVPGHKAGPGACTERWDKAQSRRVVPRQSALRFLTWHRNRAGRRAECYLKPIELLGISNMDNLFFDRPILNSPYDRPLQHWELDGQGQPTQRIISIRRAAEFITPIPQPRKRKRGKTILMQNSETHLIALQLLDHSNYIARG